MERNRWRIRKVDGRWRIYDTGKYYEVWHDEFDTLPEAHTYATQLAVTDELFEKGGLTYLSSLKSAFVALQRVHYQETVLSQ